MSRLRKIEKGNDGNVPLNVFFFSFFFPDFSFNSKLKKKMTIYIIYPPQQYY